MKIQTASDLYLETWQRDLAPPLKGGPVLCMDIDGSAAPTGSNTRFDVDEPHQGFVSFHVDNLPLHVHPGLPGWFAGLEAAYAHCAWISDWGRECVRFSDGAGLHLAGDWPCLEAPHDYLNRWHKLDAVTYWVDPDTPVAMVDDHMAPQYPDSEVDEHILWAIDIFLKRPGPTLLIAPAQEIGLTRPVVDLLLHFAHNPHDPMFAVRGVHRLYPNSAVRWPDPLPPGLKEPVLVYENEETT